MDKIQYADKDTAYRGGTSAATNEQEFARYARWAFALIAAASLLVILFVILVDPYRLFRLVDVEGFNRTKPSPEQYRQQIKLAQAEALRPNALLLGNSRIEVGLDPSSPQFGSHGYSAYNLALSGTSLDVARPMFEQVRSATAPPAMAVVGVEFLDFLVSPSTVTAAPDQAGGWLDSWQWRFDTLFSMKSLSDAWLTLRLQKASDPETMTSQGHTPLLVYRKYARREGYYMIFQQRAQENAKNLLRKPHNLYGADGSSSSIDNLRKMLTTMAQDGTEVHLIIYPYHVQLMAMFEEAGLQPKMEEWKNLLVHEVATIQSRQPSARIRLWDFSGFGPVQCESIPAPGDTHSTTRFYWEAGHFKSSVGEMIQQRIMGEASPFGVALDRTNLELNRQRISRERAHCAATNPAVFAGARSMVSAVRRETH